jgi:hypothetical protein
MIATLQVADVFESIMVLRHAPYLEERQRRSMCQLLCVSIALKSAGGDAEGSFCNTWYQLQIGVNDHAEFAFIHI